MSRKCAFCMRENNFLSFIKGVGLFSVPHEMASLGACGHCGEVYVWYSLESRDDNLDYYLQISEIQENTFIKMIDASILSKEIRAVIRNQDVFFKSAWREEWVNGVKVLLDPRPW